MNCVVNSNSRAIVIMRVKPIAPEANGDFISRQLDFGLRAVGTRIRLVDLATGELVPDVNEDPGRIRAGMSLRDELIEERKARQKLEEEAKQEAKKLETATRKAEAERRKAETATRKAGAERRKAETATRKAEAERRKAEAERRKAEAERRKAEILSAEVLWLRALLGEKRIDDPTKPSG